VKADHAGLRAWMLQRLSAVYLIGFVALFGGRLLWAPPADHAEWVAWLARPGVATAMTLAWLALAVHAWIGIRDIAMDYIHPTAARFTLLVAVAFGLLWLGVHLAAVLASIPAGGTP
jgi:succinate dehydrogenase / fumarate reductase membrane anchor subunit